MYGAARSKLRPEWITPAFDCEERRCVRVTCHADTFTRSITAPTILGTAVGEVISNSNDVHVGRSARKRPLELRQGANYQNI